VQTELFLRGDNLTDAIARVSTSFLKDFAPLPGRGVTLGARVGSEGSEVGRVIPNAPVALGTQRITSLRRVRDNPPTSHFKPSTTARGTRSTVP